jgi:hypothetical protein
MNCYTWKSETRAASAFCGALPEHSCPACGRPDPPDNAFCEGCGATDSPTPPAATAPPPDRDLRSYTRFAPTAISRIRFVCPR